MHGYICRGAAGSDMLREGGLEGLCDFFIIFFCGRQSVTTGRILAGVTQRVDFKTGMSEAAMRRTMKRSDSFTWLQGRKQTAGTAREAPV